MLRSVAISRVQQGLGFRTDRIDEIILMLQEEQRDLERGKTLPTFLIREAQTLSLTQGGSSEVTLPTDFLRRVEGKSLYYLPTGETIYSKIPWRRYDEAYVSYSKVTSKLLKVAVFRKSSILFFPLTVEANFTVLWDYYAKGVVLDANVENVWLANAPELLIGGAGRRIAADMRNKEAVALFDDMYKRARQTWFSETVIEDQLDEPMLLGANN